MTESNRRTFMKVAGVGAVAAGTAVAVPGIASASSEPDAALPAGASGALVAYIGDVTKGEITVMVQGHEVTLYDRRVTARLAKAVQQHLTA